MKHPNPGSNQALDQGCTCPVLDNGHGKGVQTDKARLDWLADTSQSIGNVLLPTKCVERNLDSMRKAIDCAMAIDKAEKEKAK